MIPLKSVRTSWFETATSMENQIFKFYHIRLKKPWRWKQILGITRNTFPKAISQDFLDLFCFFLHSSGINPRGIPLLTGWIYNKLHLCFYTSSFLGGKKNVLAQIQHLEDNFVAELSPSWSLHLESTECSMLLMPVIIGFLHMEKCAFKSFSTSTPFLLFKDSSADHKIIVIITKCLRNSSGVCALSGFFTSSYPEINYFAA